MSTSIPSLRALAYSTIQSQIPPLSVLAGAVVLRENPENLPNAARQPILNIWNRLKDSLKVFGFHQTMWSIETGNGNETSPPSESILVLHVERLFQNLAFDLKTHTYFPNAIPLDIASFAYLHREHEKSALVKLMNCIIKNRIHDLPTLDTSEKITDWIEDPQNAPTLERIHTIRLRGIEIIDIPHQILKFSQLRKIVFKENLLSNIPDSIGNMTHLQKLFLSRNRISNIPHTLGNLTQLTSLSLARNKISMIPESMLTLINLKHLFLQNNQIRIIPEHFSKLTALKEVNLNNNRINSLPGSLGNLTLLQVLRLDNNQINCLPISIGALTQLKEMNLDDNQIECLPDSLGNLSKLQILYLNNNRITHLPNSICDLKRLQILYLDDNQVCSLPVAFGKLNHLRALCLDKNQIKSLPDSIGNLTQLRKICLADNQICSLPYSLGNLSHLVWLGLSCNKITFIPDSIGNLIHMRTLYLTGNQISCIPNSLSNLTQLEMLSLAGNKISDIPMPLANLTQLRKLWLNNNQISSLPKWFSNLQNLQALNIVDNPLLFVIFKSLPPEKYSELISQSNRFKNYNCLSAFSKLCQIIDSNEYEDAKLAFQLLKNDDKNLIFETVSMQSNHSSIDLQWGKHHIFDDRIAFYRAVRLAIFIKFDRLSKDQQDAVYGQIYNLAGKPQTTDNKWEEQHVFDEVLRLIDAMDKLT